MSHHHHHHHVLEGLALLGLLRNTHAAVDTQRAAVEAQIATAQMLYDAMTPEQKERVWAAAMERQRLAEEQQRLAEEQQRRAEEQRRPLPPSPLSAEEQRTAVILLTLVICFLLASVWVVNYLSTNATTTSPYSAGAKANAGSAASNEKRSSEREPANNRAAGAKRSTDGPLEEGLPGAPPERAARNAPP
jgi:hypothetical protein